MCPIRECLEGGTESIMRPVAEAMFIENSPAPVKYLLASADAMSATVRLPIAKPSDQSCAILDQMLQTYSKQRAILSI